MNFQDLINFYLANQNSFSSVNTYSNYVRRFQNAINGNGDVATELTRIIKLTSGQIAKKTGYDPVAEALLFFDRMTRLPNISSLSLSPKTISNWRSGYSHFVKTILGQFYANTWLSANINDQVLCKMVAKSAIFAEPEVVKDVISGKLGTKNNQGKGNPEACWDHYTRCRDNNVKKGYQTKDVNGVSCIADDNTEANKAIKSAILKGSLFQTITPKRAKGEKVDYYRFFKDYEACHIWGLADDCHYYTSIPNLVLIPRAISGMSDHCQAVKDLLRFESYQRFNILPQGQSKPQMPKGYKSLTWRRP